MTTNAKPATGTITRRAECAHCGELLENLGNGWHHVYTGMKECSP